MKKEINKKEKMIALFEIVLAISLSITTAYFVNEASRNVVELNNNQKISKTEITIAAILAIIGNFVFGSKGIVSALDAGDLQNGVYTCLKTKNNSICQEFPASQCASQCAGDCIPAERDSVAQCKPGTCYDSAEGTCAVGSPKEACEANNGKWFNDPFGNIQQCKKGCCLIGDEAMFATEQQCKKASSLSGIAINFKSDIDNELDCYLQTKTQEEGACVFESEFEKTCKFTTKSDCTTLGGDFHSGYLCSATELGTNCKPEATAGCVDGKDEIYWFDSCGNRENIYDVNKIQSWNNGKTLTKNESCSLGSSGNPLANQGTCGNCDYLLGSTCGLKTDTEKLDDASKNVVCKDLRCKDETGKIRQNGESWCKYDSSIGVDEGASTTKSGILYRAVDTAGSRDFREVCIDGEIRTEPCADYRNEICVQSDTKTSTGKTFSSAACRLNLWQECISYNTDLKSDNNQNGMTPEERDDKCTKNPDCFIKTVNLGKGFTFNMCAPKYPEGFDLSTQDSGTGAQGICSLASQKCTEVWVKDMGGSWSCVSNCNCHTTKFSEQMNDLCISLGDCGTKANYAGDLTYNSKIFKSNSAKKLGTDVTLKGKGWFPAEYISALKAYASYDNSPNKFADAGNLTDFNGVIGIPNGLGNAEVSPVDAGGGMTGTLLSGVAGMGGLYLATHAAAITVNFLPATAATPEMAAGLSAVGGALAGAAIAFAALSMLIQFTGIGPALGEEGTYALLGAGAAAGALIGLSMSMAGTTAAGTSAGAAVAGSMASILAVIAVVAWVVIIAIVVFIIIEAILGAGEMKKVTYTFQCQPWQAPLGGAKCSQCGKDGLPCSKYACQSLGQTCEFINEGTGQETCVNIAPNDVSAPQISPLESILLPGFSYNGVSDAGYTVKSDENDGCIKSYQSMLFGLELNEPGQCKFDVQHTDKFDDMEFDFGQQNLFLINHTQIFTVPSLDSLGIPGYDPNRRTDFNLYVRCQDKSGNSNQNEYVINFCVKPGDDLTPPIVTRSEPVYNYVAYNQNNVNVSAFTNEPADCRWNKDDTSYELMNNNFSCNNDLDEQELYGWRCSGSLPITNAGESKFYVRCLDQPWLAGVNDSKRRAMQESYLLDFKRSQSELSIDSISPNDETIYSGVEPVSVDVEVKTSGGVDGNAECFYQIGDNWIDFYKTFGNVHSQTFQSFMAGEKELPVKCVDLAGNAAEKTAKFTIEIDTDAPKVTRVYHSGGDLNVVTDTNSDCSYVNYANKNDDACDFSFENGTLMDGSELVHTTGFDLNSIYYVKCKDSYGNMPSGCSSVVKGVDLTAGNGGVSGG